MFNKIVATGEMLVNSAIVRHIAIDFFAVAATAAITRITSNDESENGDLGWKLAVIGSGIVATMSINKALDTILEKSDIRNYDEWIKKTK